MQNINKTPQETITQKILIIDPEAKFSVRPYNNNSHEAKNPVLRENFLIDWDISNSNQPPSIEQIKEISDSQVETFEKNQISKNKYLDKANDLSLVGCFEIEKKLNPDLTFSNYIDSLEIKSNELLASLKEGK